MPRDGKVLDLGDLIPETAPVLVGGREMTAYVYGDGVPVSVAAEIERAWRDAERDAEGRIASPAAQRALFRDVVRALLPDLTYAQADAMSMQKMMATLNYLDYFKAMNRDDGEDGEGAEGTNPPDGSTTGTPAPD